MRSDRTSCPCHHRSGAAADPRRWLGGRLGRRWPGSPQCREHVHQVGHRSAGRSPRHQEHGGSRRRRCRRRHLRRGGPQRDRHRDHQGARCRLPLQWLHPRIQRVRPRRPDRPRGRLHGRDHGLGHRRLAEGQPGRRRVHAGHLRAGPRRVRDLLPGGRSTSCADPSPAAELSPAGQPRGVCASPLTLEARAGRGLADPGRRPRAGPWRWNERSIRCPYGANRQGPPPQAAHRRHDRRGPTHSPRGRRGGEPSSSAHPRQPPRRRLLPRRRHRRP